MKSDFEWDEKKNIENQKKHSVTFDEAQYAFADKGRVIRLDYKHSSEKEKRFVCVGQIEKGIVAVRYTHRNGKIRIFGAGFWRDYKKLYLEFNKLV